MMIPDRSPSMQTHTFLQAVSALAPKIIEKRYIYIIYTPRHPVIPPEVNGVLDVLGRFGGSKYLPRRWPWMSRVHVPTIFTGKKGRAPPQSLLWATLQPHPSSWANQKPWLQMAYETEWRWIVHECSKTLATGNKPWVWHHDDWLSNIFHDFH